MDIVPVDSQNNLFKITNVFPLDIVQEVISSDWLCLPWEKVYMQELRPRRKVESDDVTPRLDQYLRENIHLVSAAIGIELSTSLQTSFWVDEPGIRDFFRIHLDNSAVKVIMQCYWTEKSTDIGTTFYTDAQGTNIRYAAPHLNNTGYILKNHNSAWHNLSPGKLNGNYRVSSYTYFNFLKE